MITRQKERAHTGEVSAADPVDAPTRKTPVAIIPLTGDPALDAETLRKLFGAARLPIVYPQNTPTPNSSQGVA